MTDPASSGRRRLLAVFAHPDDETTTSGGTLARYAAEGAEVHLVSATRGEQGGLGTGDLEIQRHELPAVREAELRTVAEIYGAEPPVFLDYRDQELGQAGLEAVAVDILAIMRRVRPDVVITWGPTGISGHSDHIATNRATFEAFSRYESLCGTTPRLFYVAVPPDLASEFGLEIGGPEAEPTVLVNVGDQWAMKVQALRTYRSQPDAQGAAELFENHVFRMEAFHQVRPAAGANAPADGFWP